MKGSLSFCLLFFLSLAVLPLIAQEQDTQAIEKSSLSVSSVAQSSSVATSQTPSEESTSQTSSEEVEYVVDDSIILEKAIATYNLIYQPPIEKIDPHSLMMLVKAELIDREDLGNYKGLVLVDGRVVYKDPDKAENSTQIKPTTSLFAEVETAAQELEDQKNIGETEGNEESANDVELTETRVIYRDQNNQLKTLEIYSPPESKSIKKIVVGERGEKIRDYATTILVPKVTEGDRLDTSVFEAMPSAVSWVDTATTTDLLTTDDISDPIEPQAQNQ